MTPNAMKALFALGPEEAAMRVAFDPESQVLRSWKSGRYPAQLNMGDCFA
jgi:uncharacterized protein with PIN domain